MNFLLSKFPKIVLFISLFLIIYTFYKSEIFWDGNNRNYYKIYYLISFVLLFFSICSFFISNKIKRFLIILGISLFCLIYLFEGYLIFQDQLSKEKLPKEQSYENQTGKKWDKRNLQEIYQDLKKENNKITLSFYPKKILSKNLSPQLFPLSGLSDRKTIFCNENGYYAIYHSDRYGFNNPDSEWDEKEIEYLLVGDAYAHGACVNRPDDISSLLRNLSNKSVLNLGMWGNGPLIEYATLREYLGQNVKKVIWLYYESNDLEGLSYEKKNIILDNYTSNRNFTQNLKLKQNLIDKFITNQIEMESNNYRKNNSISELFKFIKIYYTRSFFLKNSVIISEKTSDTVLVTESKDTVIKSEINSTSFLASEFKELLILAKELTEKNNSKLYFVYLPEYNRYKKNYKNTSFQLVKNIVSELNITFIDIPKKVFEKEQNPLSLFPFEGDGHYNVEGYKKVAEIIYEFTIE